MVRVIKPIAEVMRQRPGMYVGYLDERGANHLAFELVANAIDLCLAGEASVIRIRMDGATFTIEDDGPGIPVHTSEDSGLPALTEIFTQYHNRGTWDGHFPHVHCGRLHGLGVFAVSAFSTTLVVTTRRDNQTFRQSFSQGLATSPLVPVSNDTVTNGTHIEFTLDPEIFGEHGFGVDAFRRVLQDQAHLNAGVRLVLNDECFHAPEGLKNEVRDRATALDATPECVFHFAHTMVVDLSIGDDRQRGAVALEAAVTWVNEMPSPAIRSFVSCLETRDGGTHEQGLRSAIIDAVRACVFDGQRCSSDALLEGVVAAVHVLHLSPEFGNPTKDRLQSPECETLVRETTGPALIAWLRDHPTFLSWLSARQRCD